MTIYVWFVVQQMYVSLTYPFNIVQHTLSHIVEHCKLDSLATTDNIVWSTVTSCWTNNVRQFDPSLTQHPQYCGARKVKSRCMCSQLPPISPICCETFHSTNILQHCLSNFTAEYTLGTPAKNKRRHCNPCNIRKICASKHVPCVAAAFKITFASDTKVVAAAVA